MGRIYMRHKALTLAALLIICMAFIAGCASSKSSIDKAHMPAFTDMTFETTEADLLKKEGEAEESYPSFYGGTVYVYSDREYNGAKGSVKYMTDADGKIACMSWMYESQDATEVQKCFDSTKSALNEKLGESGNSSEAQGTYGDVWYFDDMHVMVDAVITSDYNGMQVSYLKAEYSLKDTVDQKRKERENK